MKIVEDIDIPLEGVCSVPLMSGMQTLEPSLVPKIIPPSRGPFLPVQKNKYVPNNCGNCVCACVHMYIFCGN